MRALLLSESNGRHKELLKCANLIASFIFVSKKVESKTYAGNRTSANDRLSEIISDASKLNWLILNFSFFSSSLSLGMTTA